MDGLEDRVRRVLGDDRWRPDVDEQTSTEVLERVHAGARRRQARRRAAVIGAAGASVVIVAGGIGVSVVSFQTGGTEDGASAGMAAEQRDDAAAPEALRDGGDDEDAESGRSAGGESESDSAEDSVPMEAQEEGGGVPADFAPQSLTAISPEQFWVLGGGAEAALAVTTDGGASFERLPVPDAEVASDDDSVGADTIRDVRFADADNGWLFGNGLWVTHDGGASWTPVGDVGGEVVRLEAAEGLVFALVRDGTSSGDAWSVWRSPAARDAWEPLDVEPAAPQDLAVAGDLVVVSDSDDRTGVLVSQDGGESFTERPTACSPDLSPGQLSATADALWLSCPTGTAAAVSVSTDGGRSWEPAGSGETPPNSAVVGARDAESAVVSMPGRATPVDTSRDTEPVDVPGLDSPTYVGFTTRDVGSIVDADGQLFRTTDGGTTWTEVEFR